VAGKAVRTIFDNCYAIIDDAFIVDLNFNSGSVFRDCHRLTVEDHAPASSGQFYSELRVYGGFGTTSGAVVQWSNGPAIYAGKGSPESVVTAEIGSMFLRHDGGAATSMYIKESGTGNTGWVAK
jgi:hypothetical protein